MVILSMAGLCEPRVAPGRRIRPRADSRRLCLAEMPALAESSRPGRQARWDRRRGLAGRSREIVYGAARLDLFWPEAAMRRMILPLLYVSNFSAQSAHT